jgi:hypothetical protein
MPTASRIARNGAMVAGILSSIIYVTIDLTSVARYPGYSLVDQAISELSAVGAPASSTQLWQLLGPSYGILFGAFALGVLITGRGNRWLTASAWIMLAFIAWGVMWPFFPMHQRGAERNLSDLGHLILGGGSLSFMTAFIGCGAFALGPHFRTFSLVSAFTILLAGLATFAYVPAMALGLETPWLGIVERVMIYGYLLWIVVLGLALMRASPRREREGRVLVAQ